MMSLPAQGMGVFSGADRGCRPCRGVEGRRADLSEDKGSPSAARKAYALESRGSPVVIQVRKREGKGGAAQLIILI
jgi:hypothetical protein